MESGEAEIDFWIERLDAALRKNAPEFYAALAPGLSERELDLLEEQLQLRLPQDFRRLYAWKNGETGLAKYSVWSGPMNTAEEIIRTWRMMNEIAQGKRDIDEEAFWWDANWLPFLGDQYYTCVDAGSDLKPLNGTVFSHDISCRSSLVTYCSLAKWVETYARAMEVPMPFEEFGLSTDSNEFYHMYLEVNPGYGTAVMAEGGHIFVHPLDGPKVLYR